MTGRLILSFELREGMTAGGDDAAHLLPRLLRQHQLRACFLVSAAWLEGLELRKRFDLIDTLAWHEAGIWYEPPPLAGPVPRSGGPWWQMLLQHHNEHLCAQVATISRLLGQLPAAVAVRPEDFMPQIGVAAVRQGIPIVAHAPFDDRPGGSVLHIAGAGWLSRHLDLAGAIDGSQRPASWTKELRDAMLTMRDKRDLLVAGADLTPLMLKLRGGSEGEQARTFAKWEGRAEELVRHLATRYQTQTTTYRACTPAKGTSFIDTEDLLTFARRTNSRLRPLNVRDRWFSLAELFSAFVQAGHAHARESQSRERIYPLGLLGPAAPPPELSEVLVRRSELWSACVDVSAELMQTGRVPTLVRVQGCPVTPSSFLLALAESFSHPDMPLIKIPSGPLPQLYATRKEIRRAAEDLAALQGPPHGRHVHNAILAQTWTAKPW